MIKWFMERLVERIVPVIAKSFSSTVEAMLALGQAEQQSELEDAARRFEAEGKLDIAKSLRERSSQIPSNDLASNSIEIFENLANEQHRVKPAIDNAQPSTLPDFSKPAAKSRAKKTN